MRGQTKERINLVHNEIVRLREDRGNGSSLIFRKIFRKNKAQQLQNKCESAFASIAINASDKINLFVEK